MDQDEFINEAVNKHLAHQVAIRGQLNWVIALLIAILLAVLVGSWAIYRSVGFPGESVF